MSHYSFLDKHLDAFWQQALGKTLSESFCDGIVSAHGDKGYCYRSDWEQAGIHFYHGMMLYMLTYTDLMDRPKHESEQWVIDQYPKYKDILPPIRIPYIAIFHVPSGQITAQFENEGLMSEARLEDIIEDIRSSPEDERNNYKVLRYTCENDPFFRLPDNTKRERPSLF